MNYLDTGSKRFYAAISGAIAIIGMGCIIHIKTGGSPEDWMRPFIFVGLMVGGVISLAIAIAAVLLALWAVIVIGTRANKILNKIFKL